ncbi:hypothetical protein AB0A71_42635, partial [Kitasatospora aureofaciens]
TPSRSPSTADSPSAAGSTNQPELHRWLDTPRGVEQEIFAFLLVHHALRDLMHRAALRDGHDPDRISFTRTLRIVRRHVTGQAALSPLPTRQGHHPEPA